ncbi:hypothetical protein ACFOPX_05305 [Helicobacter baculiformis]|uniref:Integral membrane protein n=1 Tax=Helicobacter baculiformis TaxID=427351 RepID=A0ABV7ZIG4_9HELI|nr:hypothetical protein [Helicobacter baculiformis]
MDKLFIKQALHFANTIWFFVIVNTMMAPNHSHGVGGGMAIMLFGLLAYIGAIILVLCPNKRISLEIIALGFVLCYCVFVPPARYMGYVIGSVAALVFWACFGDKKWWLLPIPLLIGIVFSLSGRKLSVSGTLVYYVLLLFPMLCTYPIRNAHWYLRFLGVLVVTFVFWCILFVFEPLKYLKPYIGT